MKAKSEPRRNARKTAETPVSRQPILDIHGEEIDPIWQAEFRGFFWGEGTIAVNYYKSTSITASIGLRMDDGDVLREFQRRLGGRLRNELYRDGSGKYILRWAVGIAEECDRIGQILQAPSVLPFKKSKELTLWRRAVELKLANRNAPGGRHGPEVRAELHAIADQLQAMRVYKTPQ